MANEHGTFCWNECMSNDAEKAKAFYSNLIGWTYESMPMPNGATYHMAKAGDKQAGGVMQITEEMGPMPSHWMAYIAVDNVDTCWESVSGHGGEQIHPPTDIPGVGRFCIIKDPTGGVVSLITLSS